MKKSFKKVLSLLLALVMLTGLVSVCASALEIDLNYLALDYAPSADGSGAVLTKATNDLIFESEVVVPATVTISNVNYPVVGVGAAAFSGCTKVTSVTLPEGVKSIGSRAFENCTGLRVLNAPKTLATCESDAFDGCVALTVNCYKSNYMLLTVCALNSNITIHLLDKETEADASVKADNILAIVMTFITKIMDFIKGIFSKIV